MAEQFKPGDVVQLASGGPNMTVGTLQGNPPVLRCKCYWFVGGELKDAEIPAEALVKAPPTDAALKPRQGKTPP